MNTRMDIREVAYDSATKEELYILTWYQDDLKSTRRSEPPQPQSGETSAARVVIRFPSWVFLYQYCSKLQKQIFSSHPAIPMMR